MAPREQQEDELTCTATEVHDKHIQEKDTTDQKGNDNITSVQNKRWILKQFPEGKFDSSRDVELQEDDLDLSSESILEQDDSVVVKVEALSVDAFIRTRMDKQAYHGAHTVGDPVEAIGYGTVVAAGSKSKYQKGDRVLGMLQAANYAVLKTSEGLNKKTTLPYTKETSSLGMLGISGLAAYIGMFVAPTKGPQKGEVVVVSAASGAVGSLACQMARQAGASKVIGIAGGLQKKEYLLESIKVDGVVNYKDTSKSIGEQLDELCPDGIDFFFDNVGGECLDAVLARINQHSRLIVCGAASQYDSGKINDKSKIDGPSHYIMLSEKSSTMTGYNMMHYSSSFGKAMAYLAWHYYRGTIHLPEHVYDGVESFPEALETMFGSSSSSEESKKVQCGRVIIKVS